MTTVLLTDRAWPDDWVEREVLESAGLRLVAGGRIRPTPRRSTRSWPSPSLRRILTCWAQVSATTIESCAALKVIARMGVGLDNIDVAHATSRGMLVTNVPDYCVEEVSDHATIPFWCPCPRHGGEPLP